MACVGNCRHSRLASRVHQNSPRTQLLASKPRRSCTRGAVGSFQSSRQRTTKYSLGGSPWPQLKNLGRSPAFAIGPTAVEEKTKADCRTRKGTKQRTRALQRPLLLFTKTRT